MKLTIEWDIETPTGVSEVSSRRLVQRLPKKLAHTDAKLFFSNYIGTLYAGTITIGTQSLGKLGYVEQYEEMKAMFKKRFKYHDDLKYLCYSELTGTGVTHFHIIMESLLFSEWCERTRIFGSRNCNPLSFKIVKHRNEYLTYISKDYGKENKCPPFHNVKSMDVVKAMMLNDQYNDRLKELSKFEPDPTPCLYDIYGMDFD